MLFEDVRFYNAPFNMVQQQLKLKAIETIGTPAEPVTNEVGRYECAPDWADKHHAVDMIAGDLYNFYDCHTVQLKTISVANTPQGYIGLKFDSDEFSDVGRVSRYCEYSNVELGVRGDSIYPKSYIFMQWDKRRPKLRPKWFVIVDTISLYAGLRDVVRSLCKDNESQINLAHKKVYMRSNGRTGHWSYSSDGGKGRLHFTIELLDLLGIDYYLSPASMRTGEDTQCHLF